MQWLEGRFRHTGDRDSGPLQIMYSIDGREDLPEQELSHLEGYMASGPVRIGNAAATSCSSTSTASSWTPSTSVTSTGSRSTTTAG